MKCELVYASNFEEFFYTDHQIPVSEGQPIGVDVEIGDEVHLILFDDIYWNPNVFLDE